MIYLVRSIHALITLIFTSSIVYIYYSALTNQNNFFTYLSVGLIIFEAIVIVINKGSCPLGVIHKKFGDDKAFFELLLPKKAAKLAVPVLGIIAVVGILLLFL